MIYTNNLEKIDENNIFALEQVEYWTRLEIDIKNKNFDSKILLNYITKR